jgi:hypothetical protein
MKIMEKKKRDELEELDGKFSSKVPHSPENMYDGIFCLATLIDYIKKRRIEKRNQK